MIQRVVGAVSSGECQICKVWEMTTTEVDVECLHHPGRPCCALELLRYLAYHCKDPAAVLEEFRMIDSKD